MTHTSKVTRRITLALTGWLLAACSTDRLPTSPVAPAAVQSQQASQLLAGTLGTASSTVSALAAVVPLGRLIPLSREMSASATIGTRGGVVSIPGLGVTLEVPPGAVDADTQFRITAVVGNSIAYEFEPHGTTFKHPLVLRQRLGLTTWLPGQRLGGGYFKDRTQLDPILRRAKVNEQLPAVILGGDVLLKLWHFSGYLVSMG